MCNSPLINTYNYFSQLSPRIHQLQQHCCTEQLISHTNLSPITELMYKLSRYVKRDVTVLYSLIFYRAVTIYMYGHSIHSLRE